MKRFSPEEVASIKVMNKQEVKLDENEIKIIESGEYLDLPTEKIKRIIYWGERLISQHKKHIKKLQIQRETYNPMKVLSQLTNPSVHRILLYQITLHSKSY